MKLNSGLASFWVLIGIFLFMSIAIGLSVPYLVRELVEIPMPLTLRQILLSPPAITTVVICIGLPLLLRELKGRMLAEIPSEWNIVSNVIAESYTWLDLDKLGRETNALEALGFVRLMDYELVMQYPIFIRLFSHVEQSCFTGISQFSTSNPELNGFSPVIASILEEDWTLGSNNEGFKTTECISYVWRNPKSVYIRDPNLTLHEVFQAHLTFRQKMLTELGISVIQDVSWSAHRLLCQKSNHLRRKTFQEKPFYWQ